MQNAKLNSNIERGSRRAAPASLWDLLYLSCAYFIIASRQSRDSEQARWNFRNSL